MQFDSFSDFIAMGNHGVFVWSAYGISALLIVTSTVLAMRLQGKVLRDLEREQRREALLNARQKR